VRAAAGSSTASAAGGQGLQRSFNGGRLGTDAPVGGYERGANNASPVDDEGGGNR